MARTEANLLVALGLSPESEAANDPAMGKALSTDAEFEQAWAWLRERLVKVSMAQRVSEEAALVLARSQAEALAASEFPEFLWAARHAALAALAAKSAPARPPHGPE